MFNPLPLSVGRIWWLASKEQQTEKWIGYQTVASILLTLMFSLTHTPLFSLPPRPPPLTLTGTLLCSLWWSKLLYEKAYMARKEGRNEGLSPTTSEELNPAINHTSEQGGSSFPLKPWDACGLVSDSKPEVLATPHPDFWHIKNVK